MSQFENTAPLTPLTPRERVLIKTLAALEELLQRIANGETVAMDTIQRAARGDTFDLGPRDQRD